MLITAVDASPGSIAIVGLSLLVRTIVLAQVGMRMESRMDRRSLRKIGVARLHCLVTNGNIQRFNQLGHGSRANITCSHAETDVSR